jgi:hypothetical protein
VSNAFFQLRKSLTLWRTITGAIAALLYVLTVGHLMADRGFKFGVVISKSNVSRQRRCINQMVSSKLSVT